MIVPPVAGRACSEQDLTYGQVLFILSQPARAHIWRTLTRFSSAWVCNVRVNLTTLTGNLLIDVVSTKKFESLS